MTYYRVDDLLTCCKELGQDILREYNERNEKLRDRRASLKLISKDYPLVISADLDLKCDREHDTIIFDTVMRLYDFSGEMLQFLDYKKLNIDFINTDYLLRSYKAPIFTLSQSQIQQVKVLGSSSSQGSS